MSDDQENDEQKRAPGAKKGNQNARKSGYWALKRALKGVGYLQIDKRTALGAELARKRERIYACSTGVENLSEFELDLIEKYIQTDLLIENINGFLFETGAVINRRKRSLYPIVEQRTRLIEANAKIASMLGLKRREAPVMDLKTYLELRSRESKDGSDEKDAEASR